MIPFSDTLGLERGLGRILRASLRTSGARAQPVAHPGELACTRHAATASVPDDALPIVLLHGLAGAQQHWNPVIDPLRELGDVITLDLPGFGASLEPRTWTLDGACDAVLARMDALDLDRVVLVGHSLGAGVAAMLAERASHRVAALGLVSPAGFWSTPHDRAESRRFAVAFGIWRRSVLLGAGHVVKLPPMRLLAFFAMVHAPLSSLTRRECEQLVQGAAQGRSTVAAREAIVAADLFDVVEELDQPVELVWGRSDRITPFDAADRVAETIPNVRTRFLDDVGHMVMFEDREVVVDAVRSLVGRAS